MFTFTRFHPNMSNDDLKNALNQNFNQIEVQSGQDQHDNATYTTTTDTHGWTVTQENNKKVYRKKGSFFYTIGASAWAFLGSTNLPVGITTLGAKHFVDGTIGTPDSAVTFNILATGTTIDFAASNQYGGGSVGNTCYWSVTITSL